MNELKGKFTTSINFCFSFKRIKLFFNFFVKKKKKKKGHKVAQPWRSPCDFFFNDNNFFKIEIKGKFEIL
jgi:hypothetical protein